MIFLVFYVFLVCHICSVFLFVFYHMHLLCVPYLSCLLWVTNVLCSLLSVYCLLFHGSDDFVFFSPVTYMCDIRSIFVLHSMCSVFYFIPCVSYLINIGLVFHAYPLCSVFVLYPICVKKNLLFPGLMYSCSIWVLYPMWYVFHIYLVLHVHLMCSAVNHISCVFHTCLLFHVCPIVLVSFLVNHISCVVHTCPVFLLCPLDSVIVLYLKICHVLAIFILITICIKSKVFVWWRMTFQNWKLLVELSRSAGLEPSRGTSKVCIFKIELSVIAIIWTLSCVLMQSFGNSWQAYKDFEPHSMRYLIIRQ